ncbi:unnamed protein product [Brassica oleracea var. botrytis]
MISDSLPTDLITEILSRLPAKSLAKVPFRFEAMGINNRPITVQTLVPNQIIVSSSSHIRHRGKRSLEHLLFTSAASDSTRRQGFIFIVVSCSNPRVSHEVPSRPYADLSSRRPTIRVRLRLRFGLFLRYDYRFGG